jgi:hypothetical protein
MKIDLNNSSLLKYINNISKNITSKVNTEKYFKLSDEQKVSLSYTVFTLIKTSNKISLNNEDFKKIILLLIKKNEIDENYEIASILNHIFKNYDKLNDVYITKIKEIKKKTTEKQ